MDTAKVIRSGDLQAIQLPKEYRLQGDEVFVKRVGNALLLIPHDDSWRPLVESLGMFSDDFVQERQQPTSQQRFEAFE